MKVNMLDAKNQLSRLVKEAMRGKDVVIANNGEPMVRLVPVARPEGLRGWGKLKARAIDIDAAFSPAVEREVADLLTGRHRRK